MARYNSVENAEQFITEQIAWAAANGYTDFTIWSNGEERFYMNVMYADTLETAVEVPMTNIDESKYALATAIRRYFR